MDIFVIKIIDADSVHEKLLLEFKKKDISNPKKLNEHCLSYLMVDRILREFYKIEDRQIIFKGKKPLLKSGAKHFSISHSGEFIALAFSNSNCGVDIEFNAPRAVERIAKRMNFFSCEPHEFYPQWTLFEAKFKLGEPSKSEKTYQLGDYTLTAVSTNEQENFEIYIQSSQYFPPQN